MMKMKIQNIPLNFLQVSLEKQERRVVHCQSQGKVQTLLQVHNHLNTMKLVLRVHLHLKICKGLYQRSIIQKGSKKSKKVFSSKKDTTQESTKERVFGTIEVVPQSKSKSKMVVKDFTKRSYRKDHGNKHLRNYFLQHWKPRTIKSSLYFSHFRLRSSKWKLPDIQKIPGHCVLCPKQFYTNLENII